MQPFLAIERDGAIIIATFNRPQERNAISQLEDIRDIHDFAITLAATHPLRQSS